MTHAHIYTGIGKVTELGLYFLLEVLSPASTIPTIDICLLWAVLY